MDDTRLLTSKSEAFWAGLDIVLEKIREEDKVVTRERFDALLSEHVTRLLGSSDADWEDIRISNNLYMVLHTYCNTDPTKVIAESRAK